MPKSLSVFFFFSFLFLIHIPDPYPGGLERGAVQRHGFYLSMGGSLLCCSHDVWQLCALQFIGRHLGRRLPG